MEDFILKSVLKPIAIFLGGGLLLGIYHRLMFRYRCKKYLRVQEENKTPFKHYVAFLYCHWANSIVDGRRLTQKQEIAPVDIVLLEELVKHLKFCSWTYGSKQNVANNTKRRIEMYLKSYSEAEAELNKEGNVDIRQRSKILLDGYLSLGYLLKVLVGEQVQENSADDKYFMQRRYEAQGFDMNVTHRDSQKVIKNGKVYLDGEYH